jgi:hypothetical protein
MSRSENVAHMYQTLDIAKVRETIDRLGQRIQDRFPDSGLQHIAEELSLISIETETRTAYIAEPQVALRIAIGVVITVALVVLAYGLSQIQIAESAFRLDELVQFLDGALNTAVIVGAAVFFLVTVENKIKRKRALNGLHQLRSITHVIDMHQLTKDPISTVGGGPTPSSPARTMTPFESSRYLDYCAELLSLTAKLAAVYGQSIQDREVLAAVSEIESLTSDLSRKIWQKIGGLKFD